MVSCLPALIDPLECPIELRGDEPEQHIEIAGVDEMKTGRRAGRALSLGFSQ